MYSKYIHVIQLQDHKVLLEQGEKVESQEETDQLADLDQVGHKDKEENQEPMVNKDQEENKDYRVNQEIQGPPDHLVNEERKESLGHWDHKDRRVITFNLLFK